MTVWWQPPPAASLQGVSSLVLEVREFPQPWETAKSVGVPLEATQHNVTGLVPTATFEYRLRFKRTDGSLSSPGPAATADTLAAGCTPKSNDGKGKKGCSVQ